MLLRGDRARGRLDVGAGRIELPTRRLKVGSGSSASMGGEGLTRVFVTARRVGRTRIGAGWPQMLHQMLHRRTRRYRRLRVAFAPPIQGPMTSTNLGDAAFAISRDP
jgi:hypothetical protein